MANCLDDKKWKSRVPKDGSKEKGEFKITNDLGNGNFEGKFKDDTGPTDDIKGWCSGAEIWFHRPASRPQYLYTGVFIYVGTERKFIEGSREPVSFEVIDGVTHKKIRVGDDWEADKGT